MNIFLKLLVIILIIFLNSCSKKEEKILIIQEKEIRLQMIDAYKEGVKALEKGDVLFAAKNLMKQKYYFLNHNGLPNLY